MQRVSDQVDAAYLEQVPPRPLPVVALFSLLIEHLLERPFRALLNPAFIIGVGSLVSLYVLRAPRLLLAVPIGVLAGWMALSAYRVWTRAWQDMTLLRQGSIVQAHVLKLRPHRTLAGEIDGALLDCAIPVAPRRTYIGSVWLADGHEALRLSTQGRIQVLCLPSTPGTWRVIEAVRSELRYERMGAPPEIPPDEY